MVGGNVDHIHRRDLYLVARPSRRNGLISLPYDAGLSAAADTLVGIFKRIIVSPAVYPRFLEIVESAIAELFVIAYTLGPRTNVVVHKCKISIMAPGGGITQ